MAGAVYDVSIFTCYPLAPPAHAGVPFCKETRGKVVVAGSRDDSEWRVKDEMVVRAVSAFEDCPS